VAASYTTYVPSLIEILTGAGIVAYGAMAVTLGIRHLGVVDHTPEPEHEGVLERVPAAAWSE